MALYPGSTPAYQGPSNGQLWMLRKCGLQLYQVACGGILSTHMHKKLPPVKDHSLCESRVLSWKAHWKKSPWKAHSTEYHHLSQYSESQNVFVTLAVNMSNLSQNLIQTDEFFHYTLSIKIIE